MIGTCHICGCVDELTFEHVPPKHAFNNKRVIEVNFEEAIKLGPEEIARGNIQQKGSGDYTLCKKCNNLTGKWYGKAFIDWCYQGMHILIKAKGGPNLIYLNYLFPLRVLKQIITMFFSVNGPEFAKANPELVKFVLNKEIKYLNPKYRIFCYYNKSNKFRFFGTSVKSNINNHEFITMCEIGYIPFGYLMTINSRSPDARLFEITQFSKFNYNEFKIMILHPKVLPVHLALPGDYRTKKEIEECYRENVKKMNKMKKNNSELKS